MPLSMHSVPETEAVEAVGHASISEFLISPENELAHSGIAIRDGS